MPDLFLELRNSDDSEGSIPDPPLSEIAALDVLRTATFTASKLIPWGSNYSFAVALEHSDGREQLAIYKPQGGETPLYDFPDGTLYLREVAAFALSQHLGWDIVPPTVIRDGPYGTGSLQLYIEPTPESETDHTFWGRCHPEIERLILFDHLINNADRKLSHCLRDRSQKVWGIDHGLTFNHLPKLRTVLWQYVGSAISPDLVADLGTIRSDLTGLRAALTDYLTGAELSALIGRLDRLIESRRYPVLNPRRNVPYGWW